MGRGERQQARRVPSCSVVSQRGATAHGSPHRYAAGLTIPLPPDLQMALVMLQTGRGAMATPDRLLLCAERGGGLSPETVHLWFHRLYTSLKMDGCSSHSSRRTFITRAARKVSQVGGSLWDVQELASHTSLAMTQRYPEGNTEAKRRLVALI
jgi:integrase/recombinase XerC